MELVDVRRADEANDDRTETLSKFGLPMLSRKTVEHTGGGSLGTVEHVLPIINALEPKFSTKGIDLDVLRYLGLAPGVKDKWTFAATLRNKETNELFGIRCTIQGIVSEWSPNEHTPGELIDCDHVIKEVRYCDFFVGDEEIYAVSLKRPRFARSNGVDWFAPYRRALGR